MSVLFCNCEKIILIYTFDVTTYDSNACSGNWSLFTASRLNSFDSWLHYAKITNCFFGFILSLQRSLCLMFFLCVYLNKKKNHWIKLNENCVNGGSWHILYCIKFWEWSGSRDLKKKKPSITFGVCICTVFFYKL